MERNQLGGWTAVGADEQIAIAESLKAAGNTTLVQELDGQRLTRRDVVLARHREWSGKTSDTMVMLLAEDDWEAAHIPSDPRLPMNADQARVVQEALSTVGNRRTGRRTGVEKSLRRVARTMVRTMVTDN